MGTMEPGQAALLAAEKASAIKGAESFKKHNEALHAWIKQTKCKYSALA